jgi:hypothetical protein
MPRTTRPTIALVTLVALGTLVSAGTSSAATRSGASAASFCSVSKNVAKQIAGLGSSLSSTSTLAQRQATLKTQLTTIKRAEPALKSAVPRTLKQNLTIVVGFVNLAYRKLSAASWSFATLAAQPKTLAALEAASARADRSMNALDTYYRNVCKFRV